MASLNIVAVSGSLRKDSYNSALLRVVKERAPEGVTIEILDISGLAVYNQEADADFPAAVTEMKQKIAEADVIMLATPEYNRSMSGAMKNFIDWTSRPYGTAPWGGKVVFTMGASMSHSGAALAQADLRKCLLFLGAHVMGQPEFYMGLAHTKFAADGTLTDEETKAHIDGVLAAAVASKK